jgi:hypothetical protein
MQISLQSNGQSAGPFPIEQVRAGLASGIYQPSDLAWYPGAPGWMPLSNVPGIGTVGDGGSFPFNQPPRTTPLAIWSLVLGIMSFLCFVVGIPAVVCGHLALGRIKRSGGTEGGRGLAIAGLITGYLGTFIIGIAMMAGLTAPLVIRQRKKANQIEAISNARPIGLALLEFATEYGAYPNEATALQVADATETPQVTGNSSNARFRQLIRSGIIQTEVIFYSNAQGMHPPDNVLTGDRALEKGECGFAFVENLDPEDATPRPIALTPFVPGTGRFDPLPFDGKAVVLWTDGSVKSMTIERATGEVMLDGKSLLDPAHPVWSGRAPLIAFPE